MIDKIRELGGKLYTGRVDSEDVLNSAEKGEYSQETAADWLAEAALEQYREGNITDDEMIDYAEAASEVAQGETLEETFEGLELSELGPMGELTPNSPGRDRARNGMREAFRNTYFDEYDVVISTGASAYSFAEEIADAADVESVAVALDRGDLDEVEIEALNSSDGAFYPVSHVFAEDSVVEFVNEEIGGRDVLMVADRGTPNDDRGNIVQAAIDASENYDHVDIGRMENGELNL